MINYKKELYSEQVMRKALYWLSKQCRWKLDFFDNTWQVELLVSDSDFDKYKAELDSLLNDFVLREELDKKTKYFREKIISAALERLANE